MKSSASTSKPPAAALASEIKLRARAIGFDLVGITTAELPQHSEFFQRWLEKDFHGEMGYMARNADKRISPSDLLPNARSIVVAGLNYYTGDFSIGDTGVSACVSSSIAGTEACATKVGRGAYRIARYAWGERDYHDILGEKLEQLCEVIRDLGGPDTETKPYVDTGPVLERDLAQRAGIGFIGKHTNVINRSFGNWIFLGEILTTFELPPDKPEKEYCGTCHRCIDACPTHAIVGPYQLDARLCISYLTIELKGSIPVELRPLIGDRIFGCDDCLEVCPWNRFAKLSPVKEFQRCETPLLADFLAWDEGKFRHFFRDTPIFRIKRRGFLRNVCVALGNVGDASALPALELALNDAEPLVREHAAWAIERIRARQPSP